MRLEKPIIIAREHDPNHGAVTNGVLRDELNALESSSERGILVSLLVGSPAQQIEGDPGRSREIQQIEFHRERHLKLALLGHCVRMVHD